jgi:hypothetical protein
MNTANPKNIGLTALAILALVFIVAAIVGGVQLLRQSQPESPLPQASMPSLGAQSESFADHGPGRVACDGQWSDLQRQASQSTGRSYVDFMRDCMSRNPQ